MKKNWSNLSEEFDILQTKIIGVHTEKSIKFELTKLKNLGNLLELGCGNGKFTKIIAENCKSILATDISENMLSIAKQKLASLPNIRIGKSDCYNTGLHNESYDTVFMANLIHIVNNPEKVICETYRILKDNGKLIIVSYTLHGMSFIAKLKLIFRYFKYFGKPPKLTNFSVTEIRNIVKKYNFEVDELKLIGNEMSNAIFLVARKK